MTVTYDLSEFGYREKDMAADILKAYIKDTFEFMGDKTRIGFNMNSGNVWLEDEDYNTAMMNGDNLEQWFNCGNCGNEGFSEDITLNDEGCNDCIDDQKRYQIIVK